MHPKISRLMTTAKIGFRNLSLKDWTIFEEQPPFVLQFNVTDACNANCSFCAYRYTKPEGIMSMDIYEKALKEYMDMGGKTIAFNPLVGEPLLDPYLFRRLQIASSYSKLKKIYLFTNGILLSHDNNVNKLLSSGISEIRISVAAFEKEVFIRTEGINKYEEVLSGIVKLLKRNNATGRKVNIYLELRGCDQKSLFTRDFKEHIRPLVDDSFIKNNISYLKLFDNWGGLITEEDLPPGKALLPAISRKSRPCKRTFHAAILPNGEVRVCDCRLGKRGKHDELVIGDIKANSLCALWKSSVVKKIRRSFKSNNQPDICRICGFYYPA